MARILVIDDDNNLREVMSFILTEAGHEILTAANGEEGLAKLPDEPISIMGSNAAEDPIELDPVDLGSIDLKCSTVKWITLSRR